MKAFCLLAVFALFQLTSQQTCPQDPKIGNPINFVHLFKEQTDLHFDFYNTKTTFSLILQQNIPLATAAAPGTFAASQQRIVMKITDSSLPVRSWLYMIDIRYDANGVIQQIDKAAKVRSTSTAAGELVLIRSFFGDNAIAVGAPADCCLAKLEYINFYYLFSSYYKNGNGATKPACA